MYTDTVACRKFAILSRRLMLTSGGKFNYGKKARGVCMCVCGAGPLILAPERLSNLAHWLDHCCCCCCCGARGEGFFPSTVGWMRNAISASLSRDNCLPWRGDNRRVFVARLDPRTASQLFFAIETTRSFVRDGGKKLYRLRQTFVFSGGSYI